MVAVTAPLSPRTRRRGTPCHLVGALLRPPDTPHYHASIGEPAPLSANRLAERFGLFTIIVLGEMIVNVIGGVAERSSFTVEAGVLGALGLTVVFGPVVGLLQLDRQTPCLKRLLSLGHSSEGASTSRWSCRLRRSGRPSCTW